MSLEQSWSILSLELWTQSEQEHSATFSVPTISFLEVQVRATIGQRDSTSPYNFDSETCPYEIVIPKGQS